MKKTLAILTLVVMLAALIVPVAMALENNGMARGSCVNGCSPVSSTSTTYTKIDSDTHTKMVTTTVKCKFCGDDIVPTSTTSTVENHTIVKKGLYHDPNGALKHYAQKYCTKCTYSSTYTVYCTGNPCISTY